MQQSLLHWAIQNSDASALAAQAESSDRAPIDPRIADMILGESDAVKMRKLAVLLSSETSCDDCRAEALENLEFIVESLDNANDLAAVGGLHEALRHCLHSNPSVRAAAFSVLGVCSRNNPRFQQQLVDSDDPSSSISMKLSAFGQNGRSGTDFVRCCLDSMLSDGEASVRNKALFAITGFVRNWEPALVLFVKCEGPLRFLESLSNSENDRRFVSRGLFFLAYLLSNLPSDSVFCQNVVSSHEPFTFLIDMLHDVASTDGSPRNFREDVISDQEIRERLIEALLALAEYRPKITCNLLVNTNAENEIGRLLNLLTQREYSWNSRSQELDENECLDREFSHSLREIVLKLLLKWKSFLNIAAHNCAHPRVHVCLGFSDAGLDVHSRTSACVESFEPVFRKSLNSRALLSDAVPVFADPLKALLYQISLTLPSHPPSSDMTLSKWSVKNNFDFRFPAAASRLTVKIDSNPYQYPSQQAGTLEWHMLPCIDNDFLRGMVASELSSTSRSSETSISLFEHPILPSIRQSLLQNSFPFDSLDGDLNMLPLLCHRLSAPSSDLEPSGSHDWSSKSVDRLLSPFYDSDRILRSGDSGFDLNMWLLSNVQRLVSIDSASIFHQLDDNRDIPDVQSYVKKLIPGTHSNLAFIPSLKLPSSDTENGIAETEFLFLFSKSFWLETLSLCWSAYKSTVCESTHNFSINCPASRPQVIVHTSKWRLRGESTAHRATVIADCLCQMIAANAVGVDEVIYHGDASIFNSALELYWDLVAKSGSQNFTLPAILDYLASLTIS